MSSATRICWLALFFHTGPVFALNGAGALTPSVPLDQAALCPLAMLQTQALAKDCKLGTDGEVLYECDGVSVNASCGNWGRSPGSSRDYSPMRFLYFIDNLERNDRRRSFGLDLYRESFAAYLTHGASSQLLLDKDDALILSPTGIPQLSENALDGDCGQEKTRRVEVTPIQGPNWSGWMYEQVFAAPKKQLPAQCQKFTPQYRCVTLLFGNDKVAASLPNYCFLRKKVNNLRTELSFDVFMDMIKTIRFDEGAVVPAPFVQPLGK
jgi:hypothetical protein